MDLGDDFADATIPRKRKRQPRMRRAAKQPRNLDLLDCEKFVAWTIAFTGCCLDGTGVPSFHIELCAGIGRFSAALNSLGRVCIGIELHANIASSIINNCVAAVDMTAGWFLWLILDWMDKGFVASLGGGFPCATFSRARRAPLRPLPARKGRFPVAVPSNKFPWGSPDLSERDRNTVDKANDVMQVGLRLLCQAIALMLPAWVENFLYSIMGYLDEFRQMTKHQKFSKRVFAQCQFADSDTAKLFMKPTMLYLWHANASIDSRWQLC